MHLPQPHQAPPRSGAAVRLRVASRFLLVAVAATFSVVAGPRYLAAQQDVPPGAFFQSVPEAPASDDVSSIDDLLTARLEKEWFDHGRNLQAEILKTEANYIRTSVAAPDVVLYEGSFHLTPHYYLHSSTGVDSLTRNSSMEQPVMYYTGSARTPLALPVVSNLSKTLDADEASYTVNIGILPLPRSAANLSDSVHYYVVIERSVESNHTDNSVRLERFAKEFSAKPGEPIPLRLENAPPENNAYIRLENGSVFDFYEDFARFFYEHIVINGERLHFALGKQSISTVASKLTIPYSVAQTAQVRLELESVVDTAHTLPIVDTLRRPADYLAELDMARFADGPYRYRLIATDPKSGAVLFSEVHDFQKAAPLSVASQSRVRSGDTLMVGGKRVDWQAFARSLNVQLQTEKVFNERLNTSLELTSSEKKTLEDLVKAQKKNSIADIHGRAGIGIGMGPGDNLFIGIEASHPAVALDVSFGFLYAAVPYLSYTPPQNFSQFRTSPRSVGVQLSWVPTKFFDGVIEPLVGFAFYGVWSDPATPNGQRSASLLAPSLGIATEPFGALNGLGLSFAYEPVIGLGLDPSSVTGFSAKAYLRF
jgi:hypothetical protein